MSTLTECIHCGATIDSAFGADSPSEHSDAQGTPDDPRSPGDWDNICDQCNYGKGLHGGPSDGYDDGGEA